MPTQRSPKKSRVKYPRIGEHARILGVSRPHLWQVLTGRRHSRSLLQRYRTLTRGDA